MGTNFYIVYEHFDEFNQFEGVWNAGWEKFGSLKKAVEEQKLMKKNTNYRKVSNILVSFNKEKKNGN